MLEVIGVKNYLGSYLSHLKVSEEPVSSELSSLQSQNVLKAKRKQRPTEKLFCLVMFCSRDENLTFTQLEQRGQLRFTETLTLDGFIRIFYAKVRRQSICDDPKSCISLIYILCAVYFSSHLELTISDSMCGE